MNPVWLWLMRCVLALAVWPLLAAADAAASVQGGAAVERDRLAGPATEWSAGSLAERELEPASNTTSPAKVSLRKGTRRIFQPRPLARSNPAASPIPISGRQLGRPSHWPTVRSAAAADLPRLCRWLL